MVTLYRRVGLCVALALAAVPAAAQQPAFKAQHFKGKVVPLAPLLEKQGVKLDADAAAHWMALVGDDGKIYPLVKDDGSRMFFKDATLLDRPMRLTAKQVAGTQLLQVVGVHSYVKGELHEVYYWCTVCSIRTFEAGLCACCGDPMVLHEDPVK